MCKKRGSIVFSLLLVLVLTILGAGILLRSVNESKIAQRTANSTQALWLAEAGVQRTVWEIVSNSCADFVQQGTSTACASCTSCGGGNKTMAGSISGAGDFDVVLSSANTAATSTGSVPGRSSSKLIQRNIQVSIGKKSPFAFAAFANGQISLANNTFIDSYNSNNGAYSVANSATNGDVGSNGTTAGVISIGSNISLGGSVSTGPGGTDTVGSGTVITGTTTHTNNIPLPAVSIPGALTGLSSSGAMSIGVNGTQALGTGDYKYSGISMGNNSTLNITGNVRLYLTGASSFSTQNNIVMNISSGANLEVYADGVVSIINNAVINNSGNPPKSFQVFSTYTGADGVEIKNNGILSAAIYAPSTNVIIGNNDDLFGSVVASAISVNNNSAIHYDESLKTLATVVGSEGVTLWQEI